MINFSKKEYYYIFLFIFIVIIFVFFDELFNNDVKHPSLQTGIERNFISLDTKSLKAIKEISENIKKIIVEIENIKIEQEHRLFNIRDNTYFIETCVYVKDYPTKEEYFLEEIFTTVVKESHIEKAKEEQMRKAILIQKQLKTKLEKR